MHKNMFPLIANLGAKSAVKIEIFSINGSLVYSGIVEVFDYTSDILALVKDRFEDWLLMLLQGIGIYSMEDIGRIVLQAIDRGLDFMLEPLFLELSQSA